MPDNTFSEESLLSPEEAQALRDEVSRLNLELRKTARELRIAKSFLDKVTKAAEAKDILNNALSDSNIQQRAYTDMLLRSCPNIIILLDKAGRFVLSTDIWLAVTNTPNFDYIKNRNYEEVLSPYLSAQDMLAFKDALERASSSDEAVSFDVSVDFSKTGLNRFYSVEMRRTGAGLRQKSGATPGVLIVMVDLTDFMQERERAKAANNAKSEFLATMSHEIRTPMNVIIGLSDMLERSELTPRQNEYVFDIRNASNSLLSIINDILDFSKIEAGKMELVNVNYNLKALLDNLHSMFSTLGHSKQLTMQFEMADDLPERVYGDELRLRQVLTNLLSNAVKYTKQGTIALRAQVEEGTLLRFDITDTGVGIRDEDKAELFQPFGRLDVRSNRTIAGTGLGLAITYNLCQAMGGKLWVRSVYGEGSTFSVSLPFTEATQSAAEEPAGTALFMAPEAKVLVVDDIQINLTVAEALLSTFDIHPDLALSGREAVALAQNNRYDVIFMDHMMPEIDGLETTKLLRALDGWYDHAPIIALTANALSGVDRMFIEHRLDDFLPKPIDVATLSLCLRKWLPENLLIEEK